MIRDPAATYAYGMLALRPRRTPPIAPAGAAALGALVVSHLVV
jgi:hypothetical protein